MKKITLALILSIGLCPAAYADWGQGAAAYKCDGAADLPVIEATMDSSADRNINASPGFTELRQESNSILCVLRGAPVKATILIGQPQASGMCGAIGQVAIRNLTVGQVVPLLTGQQTDLHWD
jgi:hypothetical protein